MVSRIRVAIAGFLSLAALSGCGGESTSPVVPTPPTAPPVTRTVVLQGGFELPSDWYRGAWFTTGRSGNMDITVDWTHTDSVVWVYLAQGHCTDVQIQAPSARTSSNPSYPRQSLAL